MRAGTSRLATFALLVIVVGASTGCAAKPGTPRALSQTSPGVTTSTPYSGPSAPTPAVSDPATAGRGPITTPTGSDKQRAAIIQAAASALGLKSGVVVSQLFVQDGAAVGDLHTSASKRVFFAVTGGPSAWKLAWSAPFGSASANAAGLTASDPGAFTDLAKAIDFNKTVANSTAVDGPGPTVMCFQAYVRTSAKSLAGASYAGSFKITAKIAKDSAGTWWGNGIAEPSDAGLESIGVWGRWNGTAWKGEIADFSTEGADAGYFPADVLAKLAL